MLLLLLGCTNEYKYKYGVQSPINSYAAARIAVLKCHIWPKTATLQGVGMLNAGVTIMEQLCDTFNKELLRSFKGQPFVKGKSPRTVERLLLERNKKELLNTIFSEWDTPRDCEVCEDPVQYYKYHLATKKAWIKFTNEVSVGTGYSDAILLPLVLNANENLVNERGLIRAKRQAKVIALLLDAETGELKWAGTKTASASNSEFNNDIGDKKLLFPDWDIVYQRLFSNTLWIEFPGRQEQ